MSNEIVKIDSISKVHEMLGLEKPSHPLVSLIDVSKLKVTGNELNVKLVFDFYIVSLKDKSCGVQYGRNSIDFDEGVMAFSAPGQVYTPTETVELGEIEGWMLLFHPDLIRNTNLINHIDDYSFFDYQVYEALHLSEEEQNTVNNSVKNIEVEYKQRIDNFSQRVLVSNIELLLNYSLRYYERQFNTRVNLNKGVVSQFQKELSKYFKQDLHIENGLPSIEYFAEKAFLSQHYFSDLLKKETGRAAKDHINDFVIEKAKKMLLSSEQTVGEIAYELGFNYPHYFTRIFKAKTGITPVVFRNLN